jgi:hypothetical protein
MTTQDYTQASIAAAFARKAAAFAAVEQMGADAPIKHKRLWAHHNRPKAPGALAWDIFSDQMVGIGGHLHEVESMGRTRLAWVCSRTGEVVEWAF